MRRPMRAAPILLGVVVLLAAACSPEANRERGERGADVGNRPRDSSAVDLHGKTNPDFDVPLVGTGVRQ